MQKPVIKFLTDCLAVKDRQLKGFAASFPAESERFSVAADFCRSAKAAPGVVVLSDGTIPLSNEQVADLVKGNRLILLDRSEKKSGVKRVPEELFRPGNMYCHLEQPLFFRDPMIRFGLNKWFFPDRGQSITQIFYWGSMVVSGPCDETTFQMISDAMKKLKPDEDQVRNFENYYRHCKELAAKYKVTLEKLTLIADGIRMGWLVDASLENGVTGADKFFKCPVKSLPGSVNVNIVSDSKFECLLLQRMTQDRDLGDGVTNKESCFFIG